MGKDVYKRQEGVPYGYAGRYYLYQWRYEWDVYKRQDMDYKLAPEYPFPTAFHEAYEVCRWTFSKLKEWDADEKRVSMGGHSAGAILTAAVALKANQTKEFALCLQVLDYGAFDMATDPADKKESATNLIPAERGRMFTEAYTCLLYTSRCV